MRRAAKVDGNQADIVRALRLIGVSVEIIGKPVDLLICHRGETRLIEVKNPDGSDRPTLAQIEFYQRWPGVVHIVRSPEEAVKMVLGEKVMA